MDTSVSVELFVEILNRYVYYFDQQNETVSGYQHSVRMLVDGLTQNCAGHYKILEWAHRAHPFQPLDQSRRQPRDVGKPKATFLPDVRIHPRQRVRGSGDRRETMIEAIRLTLYITKTDFDHEHYGKKAGYSHHCSPVINVVLIDDCLEICPSFSRLAGFAHRYDSCRWSGSSQLTRGLLHFSVLSCKGV
jgi:hypothetical protein